VTNGNAAGQRPAPPAPAPGGGGTPPVGRSGTPRGRADAPADSFPPARPVLLRLLVRSWEYRRPRLWVGVRLACGIFNVVLGVLLLAAVRWLGALTWLAALPLAGAALIFWTVYLLQQDSVRRVREVEQSRARVVDDSAARLRRIERDLHDGAQAQLVAVAMKLGLAREKLGGAIDGTGPADLERVLELVDAAHRGAKEAIAELRDLARGIHPPILDHGLGTALTTLAARCGVPVELVVDVPQRPAAAIEAIAYFCAAELLANVAKHSGARQAVLTAARGPGVLRVRVSDDGAGGARVEARGGLAGLAERIATVDGRLQVSSPAGGPTVVTVELPSPT
jgi:signal transduction histidine kinase